MAFTAPLQAYLRALQAQRYSKSSLDQARRVLPRFFLHLRDKRVAHLAGVSEAHVLSFARELRTATSASGRGFSAWTQSAYLSALRAFFSFLEKRRLILVNPAREVRLPKGRRLPRALLTEAQTRRLVCAPFPGSSQGLRDRALLETLYGTAIRCGECRRVDLLDVDLRDSLLLVRNGKGRKDRMVPIPGRARAALDDYLRLARPELVRWASEAALFVSRGGKRLSTNSVGNIVRQAAHLARIPTRPTPHSLRHACATHLLRNGADVRHVQELLGHKNLETTALYTRVALKDLRDAVERSHPRDRVAPRRPR